MNQQVYLCLAGNEVSNGNRVAEYLRRCLGPEGFMWIDDGCDCFLLDSDTGTYLSPSEDPAPWYVPARPESGEFMGFLAEQIEVISGVARSVTLRSGGGAVIGVAVPKPILISVRGLMFAASNCGLEWGQRWLEDVLQGSCGGCAADTLEILPCCPHEDDPDPELAFRTLYQVGIVDGPIFGRPTSGDWVQEVSFQLVAGIPYLYGPPELCMDSVEIAPEGS